MIIKRRTVVKRLAVLAAMLGLVGGAAVVAMRPPMSLATWEDAGAVGDLLSGIVAAATIPIVAIALILQAFGSQLQLQQLRLQMKEVRFGRQQGRQDQIISIVMTVAASRLSLLADRMRLDPAEDGNRGRIDDITMMCDSMRLAMEHVVDEAFARGILDESAASSLRALIERE